MILFYSSEKYRIRYANEASHDLNIWDLDDRTKKRMIADAITIAVRFVMKKQHYIVEPPSKSITWVYANHCESVQSAAAYGGAPSADCTLSQWIAYTQVIASTWWLFEKTILIRHYVFYRMCHSIPHNSYIFRYYLIKSINKWWNGVD